MFRTGELDRASAEFAISNAGWSRIRAQRPDDHQAQQSAANTLNLTTDVLRAQGRIKEAFVAQQEALGLAEVVYAQHDRNDRDAQYRLINAERRVARLAFEVGESARALDHLKKARDYGIDLLHYDPENAVWQESLALTITDLAAAALLTGDLKAASAELARADLERVLSKPEKPGVFTSRLQAQIAARAVAARLSVARGEAWQGLVLAEMNARDLAALGEVPPPEAAVFTGETEIILGDVLAQTGSADAALHWHNAERLKGRALGPRAMYAVMQALCRRGARDGAFNLASQLTAAGYVRPLSAAIVDKCGN